MYIFIVSAQYNSFYSTKHVDVGSVLPQSLLQGVNIRTNWSKFHPPSCCFPPETESDKHTTNCLVFF